MIIRQLHEAVWKFRIQANAYWPTPDLQDSLRYAFTEAAEALDAWMRMNRPDHVRNRDKDLSVEAEMADCLIMLLTALGPEWSDDWGLDIEHRFKPTDVDNVCFWVGLCQDGPETMLYLYEAVGRVVSWFGGETVLDEVNDRLERIKQKHGLQQV